MLKIKAALNTAIVLLESAYIYMPIAINVLKSIERVL